MQNMYPFQFTQTSSLFLLAPRKFEFCEPGYGADQQARYS
jgi:hypothetical protein